MEWTIVKFAHDCIECDCCGEPFCETCALHYADCQCPGPHMEDEFEYAEFEGHLLARRIK